MLFYLSIASFSFLFIDSMSQDSLSNDEQDNDDRNQQTTSSIVLTSSGMTDRSKSATNGKLHRQTVINIYCL